MKTQTQCKVKFYRNRYGGFGIVPEDSTLIGSAVDIAVCQTKEDAQDICNALNTQSDLIEACVKLLARCETRPDVAKWLGLHDMKIAVAEALGQPTDGIVTDL